MRGLPVGRWLWIERILESKPTVVNDLASCECCLRSLPLLSEQEEIEERVLLFSVIALWLTVGEFRLKFEKAWEGEASVAGWTRWSWAGLDAGLHMFSSGLLELLLKGKMNCFRRMLVMKSCFGVVASGWSASAEWVWSDTTLFRNSKYQLGQC